MHTSRRCCRSTRPIAGKDLCCRRERFIKSFQKRRGQLAVRIPVVITACLAANSTDRAMSRLSFNTAKDVPGRAGQNNYRQTRQHPYASALLRRTPSASGDRPEDDSNAPGTQAHQYHHDLYPHHQGRGEYKKPVGQLVAESAWGAQRLAARNHPANVRFPTRSHVSRQKHELPHLAVCDGADCRH